MKMLRFLVSVAALTGIMPVSAETWIVHPDASPPYDQIYADIKSGITSVLPTESITPSQILSDKFSWNTDQHAITLGQTAFDALTEKPPTGQWIAGVLTDPPVATSLSNDVEIIDILPAAETVLKRIAQLNPSLEMIHVVVNSDNDDARWKRYQTLALEKYRLVINVHEARDSVATAKAWFQIIESFDSTTEAVWLTSDQHLESTGSLEYILKSSWKKNFVVVSSIPRHAFKGVSLAFVPDWFKYGRLIALRVLPKTDGLSDEQPDPESVHRLVINMRMLSHIGLGLPDAIRDDVSVLIEQ